MILNTLLFQVVGENATSNERIFHNISVLTKILRNMKVVLNLSEEFDAAVLKWAERFSPSSEYSGGNEKDTKLNVSDIIWLLGKDNLNLQDVSERFCNSVENPRNDKSRNFTPKHTKSPLENDETGRNMIPLFSEQDMDDFFLQSAYSDENSNKLGKKSKVNGEGFQIPPPFEDGIDLQKQMLNFMGQIQDAETLFGEVLNNAEHRNKNLANSENTEGNIKRKSKLKREKKEEENGNCADNVGKQSCEKNTVSKKTKLEKKSLDRTEHLAHQEKEEKKVQMKKESEEKTESSEDVAEVIARIVEEMKNEGMFVSVEPLSQSGADIFPQTENNFHDSSAAEAKGRKEKKNTGAAESKRQTGKRVEL